MTNHAAAPGQARSLNGFANNERGQLRMQLQQATVRNLASRPDRAITDWSGQAVVHLAVTIVQRTRSAVVPKRPWADLADGAPAQAWALSYWETTDAGMRPRSLTWMPCFFDHSRTAEEW